MSPRDAEILLRAEQRRLAIETITLELSISHIAPDRFYGPPRAYPHLPIRPQYSFHPEYKWQPSGSFGDSWRTYSQWSKR